MSDRNPQVATPSEAVSVSGASIYGTYDTARGAASVFAFFGWVIVVVGIVAALAGLSVGAPFNFLIVAIGVGIGAVGCCSSLLNRCS
jgi:hypothetical protein